MKKKDTHGSVVTSVIVTQRDASEIVESTAEPTANIAPVNETVDQRAARLANTDARKPPVGPDDEKLMKTPEGRIILAQRKTKWLREYEAEQTRKAAAEKSARDKSKLREATQKRLQKEREEAQRKAKEQREQGRFSGEKKASKTVVGGGK